MTDLEKFVALYKEVGITLNPKENDEGFFLMLEEESDDSKITGYYRFYTSIQFDKNGKFMEQGIWE